MNRILMPLRRPLKTMSRPSPHRIAAPLMVGLSLALLSCGSSDHSLAHIQGTSATISKATLNHWMRALSSGDYRQNLAAIAPQGLVAEPADYPECARAAKRIVPRAGNGQLKLTDAQIGQKCRELYAAVKAQALSFLISVEWTVAEGEELGVHVTNALVEKEYARYRKEAFKTDTEFRKYISERGWTVSDMLYRYKRSLLTSKILPKFQEKVKQAGGGERAYFKLALERYRQLISRTSCKPGYVVPECKEYREPATAQPSPRDVLKAFVLGQA
jgi:hypothetical protein